jgi:hypothetical protein
MVIFHQFYATINFDTQKRCMLSTGWCKIRNSKDYIPATMDQFLFVHIENSNSRIWRFFFLDLLQISTFMS